MTGRLRVLPSGVEFDSGPGETVMAAAVRAGYRWPSVCGGQGACRTCFVLVQSGAENCSAVGGLEAEGIEAIRRTVTGDVRLACQVRVSGGTTVVLKRGVRLRAAQQNPDREAS